MIPSRRVATTGIIAAVYAAATLLTMQLFSVLSYGPVQFRISEALVFLPLFFAEALPGLAIGCFLANLAGMALLGTGALGLFDVVLGTLATFLGALWTHSFRNRKPTFALAGPVIANALIVPAYLPLLLKGLGYYTLPFTGISLESSYLWCYIFGVVTVGIGETLVVYGLGLPLVTLVGKRIKAESRP